MRSIFRRLLGQSRNGVEEPAHDAWLGDALGALDPARRDPHYWDTFHRGVLLSAAPELARRRRRVEVTLSDVLSSWARALVPAAAMASVAAFVVLKPQTVESPAPFRLEEILWDNMDVSAADLRENLTVEVSLAVDIY